MICNLFSWHSLAGAMRQRWNITWHGLKSLEDSQHRQISISSLFVFFNNIYTQISFDELTNCAPRSRPIVNGATFRIYTCIRVLLHYLYAMSARIDIALSSLIIYDFFLFFFIYQKFEHKCGTLNRNSLPLFNRHIT